MVRDFGFILTNNRLKYFEVRTKSVVHGIVYFQVGSA